MLEKIVDFFARRHLLANFIFLSVLIGGVFAWNNTNKEELPAITFDTVRISVRYPGAAAEDVEYFVTRPMEEKLRGVDGVFKIESNSSVGSSSISVELEPDYPNVDEAVTEIRNTVLDVDLPLEVIDDPVVRVFKTTKKAILDIALIHKEYPILTPEGRKELQEYALALENQLLTLRQVHSLDRRNYLQEEIQIKVYPDRLARYDIPFNTVMREIRENHIRKPAGTVETANEPKVTLLSELNSPEKLKKLAIQGGFEGKVIPLGDVSTIERGYEKSDSVMKVNGYEAVMFSVVKTGSAGILDALDAVTAGVERFRKNNLTGTPIEVIFLDDESIDVRNRLNLISINGSIGFLLILATLFIFLNKRSGLWVAMGIPFTAGFTMICSSMMGYTINGTTLAAVIIVMGMIVDDAIIVAENITRMSHQGIPHSQAVIKGTSTVILPITASILTTCVAFIPLFFFSGRYGKFIEFIPPIIFLMLGASLIESILILPGHMDLPLPSFLRKKKAPKENGYSGDLSGHWFDRVETWFGGHLEKLLSRKSAVLAVFIILLGVSGWIVGQKMKFVMFPNEETRDLVLHGYAPREFTRYQTAGKVREIEDQILPYLGKEVVAFRTQIAQSRRGSAVEENRFRMIIEIVPREKRKKSADELVAEFEEKIKNLNGFTDIKFQKSRWGQDSGSPVEIIVQQNNDEKRHKSIQMLAEKMKEIPALKSVEVDEGFRVAEYRVDIDREKIKRLSINAGDIASTFRAALEGSVLYEFPGGDEEIHVRFSVVDDAKNDIEKVLDLPVENRGQYLVPLRNIVTVKEVVSPNSIARLDLKRTSLVYADIEKSQKKTPLDIAEILEETVFPEILAAYPTTAISFGGEIRDTRESTSEFKNAIIMVIILIYFILAVLFNSLVKPIIIMSAIPFGVVGVILAFYLHGKTLFGFYAAVGALGLAGVVINDSIVLLVKLEESFDSSRPFSELNKQVSSIAQTRLRAVLLTTLTTVVGVLPTAYGFAGYDAMLADMMLALAWGLMFGTMVTLVLIPSLYAVEQTARYKLRGRVG